MSTKIVQTPAVALYTGMSTSITTMRITPFPLDLDGTKLAMSDWGTIGYATIDPGIASYEEIVSFTGITDNGDNTATLTGLTRDLKGKSDYTAGTGGKVHGSSAVVVFSDNPQIFQLYGALANDNTWAGKQTFAGGTVARVVGTTSSATPTPNIDTTTVYKLTALATNATFGAPTGTPTDGQVLIFRIKSDSSIRTLAWNAAYVARGVSMPTATVASKYTIVGFMYNADTSTWDCVSVDQEA